MPKQTVLKRGRPKKDESSIKKGCAVRVSDDDIYFIFAETMLSLQAFLDKSIADLKKKKSKGVKK